MFCRHKWALLGFPRPATYAGVTSHGTYRPPVPALRVGHMLCQLYKFNIHRDSPGTSYSCSCSCSFGWRPEGTRVEVPRIVKKNASAERRYGIWPQCISYNWRLGETNIEGVPELTGQTCLQAGSCPTTITTKIMKVTWAS